MTRLWPLAAALGLPRLACYKRPGQETRDPHASAAQRTSGMDRGGIFAGRSRPRRLRQHCEQLSRPRSICSPPRTTRRTAACARPAPRYQPADDIDCPERQVRIGAGDPDHRQQAGRGANHAARRALPGRASSEDRARMPLNAGMMTIKVGIEGRIITGSGRRARHRRRAAARRGGAGGRQPEDDRDQIRQGRRCDRERCGRPRQLRRISSRDITFPLPQPLGLDRQLRRLCRLRSARPASRRRNRRSSANRTPRRNRWTSRRGEYGTAPKGRGREGPP